MSLEYSICIKLPTKHHLEFLSLKVGCTGSSESTHAKHTTLLEITCHGSNVELNGELEKEPIICVKIHLSRSPFSRPPLNGDFEGRFFFLFQPHTHDIDSYKAFESAFVTCCKGDQ